MASANGVANATAPDISHITSQLQKVGISEVPSVAEPKVFPQYNPVDVYRAHITQELAKIVPAAPDVIYNSLQWTQELKHGDLMLPVPALRLSAKEKKPETWAQEIADKFDSNLIEKPTAEKAFVRFFFKPKILAGLVLPSILKLKGQYGFNPMLGLEDPGDSASRKKRVIIEYSSPNIAKEFHTGHLRSTIIGGFLAKLYERAGWEVISMNYLGDWGKQYGVLSQGFDKYGSEEEFKKDPVKHLNEVYVKINQDNYEEQKLVKNLKARIDELKKLKDPPKPKKPAKGEAPEPVAESKWSDEQEKELQDTVRQLQGEIKRLEELPSIDETARRFFKRMVENDAEAVSNYQRFREESIKKYEEMYARLNIKFDDYSGESTVKEEDMAKAAERMLEKGVSEENDGAVIVDFAKHKAPKLGKAIVRKKDGTALYLTRDIAANFERFEKYGFDKMIYVIASQQDTHVAQFFKILELMGPPYSDIVQRCINVTFGMVKDPKGQTMSTRKGTVISLQDSLDDAGEFMHGVMKKNKTKYELVEDPKATADTLGISAMMVQDFSGKRINGYNFDMERMTSFEGDTGPYLQYAHARLCSMRRKTAVADSEMAKAAESSFGELITAREGVEVVRALAQWPDVFLQTLKTNEPVTILTYLFKMSHLLSASYDAKDRDNKNAKTMSVMYAETAEKKAALMALYECARQVLFNGMVLLGLSPVERM